MALASSMLTADVRHRFDRSARSHGAGRKAGGPAMTDPLRFIAAAENRLEAEKKAGRNRVVDQ